MTTTRAALRNYTRWRTDSRDGDGLLTADLLGVGPAIVADPTAGRVAVDLMHHGLSPDEARLIGVRLIEAAALADGDRAIRQVPEQVTT